MDDCYKKCIYNPIYDFFPVLVFTIVNNHLNTLHSVGISSIIVALCFVAAMIFRKEMAKWNVFITLVALSYYLVVAAIVGNSENSFIKIAFPVIVIDSYLLVLLLLRRKLTKCAVKHKAVAPCYFEEFYKVLKLLMLVFTIYLIFYFFFSIYDMPFNSRYSLVIMLVIVNVYELIRTVMIKNNFSTEEWYPIVEPDGRVIGKVEKLESLMGNEKYLHPIIRVHILVNDTIYLQKRKSKNVFFHGKWDAAVSNHVLFGETIDECISRTIKEKYGLEELTPVYYTCYEQENEQEKQLAFVYYTTKIKDLKPVSGEILESKFWTMKQVHEELNSGIFTENLVREFEFLCNAILPCEPSYVK